MKTDTNSTLERLALSATELMARLGISRSTLAKLIQKNALKPVPQIGKRFFSMKQVNEFLEGKQ